MIFFGIFAAIACSGDCETVKSPDPATPPILEQLEALYPAPQVDDMLEALPMLERHFEDEDVTTPRQALRAHLQEMNAEEVEAFAESLRSICLYAEMIRMLGNGLPNGYHDLTFSLPLSQKLYQPTLATYGLDLDATVNDVASSLSTYDNTKMRVHTAIMLSKMDEKSRMTFLEGLVSKAAQLRHPQGAKSLAPKGE